MPSRISQMRNEPLQSQTPRQYQIDPVFLNQLKTLMRSKNASQYLTEIAAMNPQFKQMLEMAKTGNIRPLYEQLARQQNVDPNWLVNQLLSD